MNTSRSLIFSSLFLIILAGIFLRFYNIEEVYTEYDDVGVVALHHSLFSDDRQVVKYDDGILKANIKVSSQGLKEGLLDSFWYPVYLGHTWTYPIGQYLFYPVVINEDDSYSEKVRKSRYFSAFFSSLSLPLLLYLLFIVNGRVFSVQMLFPIAILAFSYNSVLYAHHASPYSVTVTTFILSLIWFVHHLRGRINPTNFYLLHGVLFLFNYLILLSLPLYFAVYLIKNKLQSIANIIQLFYKGFALFLVIAIPISVVFLKPLNGLRGVNPPDDFSLQSLMYFPEQFVISVASSIAGLVTDINFTILFVGIIFIVSIILFFYKKNQKTEFYLILFIFLLTFEWMFLHSMEKIVMDQTRHMLMWTPIVALLLFFILKQIKLANNLIVAVVMVVSGLSVQSNISLIQSKSSNFDFELIKSYDVKNIFTYGFTLSPLIAYPSKNVYNIDVNSFNKGVFSREFPEKGLLVSQWRDINTYLSGGATVFAKEFLDNYNITPVVENHTNIYFPYNNYSVSSGENGFYLYQMTLKPGLLVETMD